VMQLSVHSRLGEQAAATELTQAVRRNLLVSGGAAWLLTVAVPALDLECRVIARVTAFAALVCLLGGVVGASRWPRVGRLVSLLGFIGMCALTWGLLGDIISPERLQPLRAAVGGVAWLTFALGWGAVRHPGAVPENDPRVIPAEPLEPRSEVAGITYAAVVVSTLAAVVPWLLAWRAQGRDHALFAQAIGLGAAMWLLSAGADTAVALGARRRWLPSGLRLQQVSGILGTVTLLALAGVVYWQLGNPR
jgi:hypothetical protein